jgi:hypothetical protein
MKEQFLAELGALLAKYDVSIGFTCSECSDTYGLSDDGLIITHRISKDSFKDETWYKADSWWIDATDFKVE